jgi:hypothetical protein
MPKQQAVGVPDDEKSQTLMNELYLSILTCVNCTGLTDGLAMLHDYRVRPHPAGATVLSGEACPLCRFTMAHNGWTFTDNATHLGNSAVRFHTDMCG